MEREDQLIRQDILDELNWDARLGPLEVSVDVNEGHVTLTGVVPTMRERASAERIVAESPGVLSVDNHLRVATEERLSDREIADEVIARIKGDSRLANQDVEVDCSGGAVTLSGTVDSFWKRRRMVDIARDQAGVTDIVDDIAVAGGSVADEELSYRITELLRRRARVDENTIAVTVENGVATLRGTVPTWMVRSMAYDTAANIEGVRNIVDEMSVDQR
jgi:osmotically-inducible protein OsmY